MAYDQQRQNYDAATAVLDNRETGIPGVQVDLYSVQTCAAPANLISTPTCEYVPVVDAWISVNADGSFQRVALVASNVTEEWTVPVLGLDCIVRDNTGKPIPYNPGYTVQVGQGQGIYNYARTNSPCIESGVMGTQIGRLAKVDGKFHFDNLVEDTIYIAVVRIPNETLRPNVPMFKVRREEDVNKFDRDNFTGPVWQDNPTQPELPWPQNVDTPSLVRNGRSPFEGLTRRLCDAQIFRVRGAQPVNFHLFTDVPIPGWFRGQVLDDIDPNSNPHSVLFGGLIGVPNIWIGVYYFTFRLITQMQTDPDGAFQILLPSSRNSANQQSHAGTSYAMYYIFGNDPNLNQNLYPRNRNYDSIGAPFEVTPGGCIPADLALTPAIPKIVVADIGQIRGKKRAEMQDIIGVPTFVTPDCNGGPNTPHFYSVSPSPIVCLTKQCGCQSISNTISIQGSNFGSEKGAVVLFRASTNSEIAFPVSPKIVSWTDSKISITVGLTTAPGRYQILVRSKSGEVSTNGITIHVLGKAYCPTLISVNDPKASSTKCSSKHKNCDSIQSAIDLGSDSGCSSSSCLIMVYPKTDNTAYSENIILYYPVAIQGVGPGNTAAKVPGTQISGLGYGYRARDWRVKLLDLAVEMEPKYKSIQEGQVIFVLSNKDLHDATVSENSYPMIDGISVSGGFRGAALLASPVKRNGYSIVGVQGNFTIFGGFFCERISHFF